MDLHLIATMFVLRGLQRWAQPVEERTRRLQDVLDAAGFDVTASGPCEYSGEIGRLSGRDADAAAQFLLALLRTLPAHDFKAEVAHVRDTIAARRARPIPRRRGSPANTPEQGGRP